jgi:hypothetical protein
MSNIKEKYISESLLKDKPKKKLSLMLGDGVVTTQKIHDGAVTEDKLASQSVTADKLNDDVISIMSSIEEGGIPLQQNFGNHENLGISQKFLTEEIGEEYDSSEDTVKGHIKAIEDSIGTGEEGSGTIKDRISSLETAVEAEDGSVNSRINAVHEELNDGLQDEIDRATNIEGGLRNDVSDINNTLTQDLGFAPAGVDKSAHERITDLVEEGIRTVELGQAALDETPVQGHDTTVVTSDGLFKRFADITKELEFSTEPERQQLSIESSYGVDIDVTNSVITEASSSAQSSRVVQIKERLNKGDIIHFEAQVQGSSQMRIVCAFSRTNLLEDGATVSGSPVDIIYNVTSTNYTFDLEIAVPYDGAYFLLRYLNNTSTNGIRFVSGSVHYTLYHVGSLKGHIQNLNENMYQFDINGADDTLAYTYIKSIKPEHTYKLTVKDVNISMAGVTVSNSYTKIAVQYTLDEGTTFGTDYLVKTMIGAALEESYTFTIPALTGEDISALSIRVSMRASRNAKQTFILEDVTETVKLKEEVGEIGLKKDVTIFPDLAIGDEEGNDIVRFEEGHVKTKHFDSRELATVRGIAEAAETEAALGNSQLFVSNRIIIPSGSTLNGVILTSNPGAVASSGGTSSGYGHTAKLKLTNKTVISWDFENVASKLRIAVYSSDAAFVTTPDTCNDYLAGESLESDSSGTGNFTVYASESAPRWISLVHQCAGNFSITTDKFNSWVTITEQTSRLNSLEERFKEDVDVLSDLSFCDEEGNIIVRFGGGHVKTKNFDSADIHDNACASLSQFARIAVIGDSWSSGYFYSQSGSSAHVDIRKFSWVANLARRNGVHWYNFAVGGGTVASWLGKDEAQRPADARNGGLKQFLEAPACDLYFVWFGANERSRETYNMGTIADAYLPTDPDTEEVIMRERTVDSVTIHEPAFPHTFYGNTALCLWHIAQKAPLAKVVFMCGDSNSSYTGQSVTDGDLNGARLEIIEKEGLPRMRPNDDTWYYEHISQGSLLGNHPDIMDNSGMALMVERLFPNIVNMYRSYFRTYYNKDAFGLGEKINTDE